MTQLRRFCFTIVSIGACSFANSINSPRTHFVLHSLGRTRSFDIEVPTSYSTGAAMPVLLVFHGAGGTGRSMQLLTGLGQLAERYGFIAVYPNADAESRGTWALGCNRCTWADAAGIDDYRFVRDMIDTLAAAYSIDRQRIFATGFSLGGSFAYDLACHEPDLLAGTAVVASLPSLEEVALCRAATRAQRVLTAIGAQDPNVPWNGGGGGSGATYRSAPAVAADWGTRNRCSDTARTRELPHVDGNGVRVTVLEYMACPEPGLVRFFRIEGAGHEWPMSRELDFSAELARTFFGTG